MNKIIFYVILAMCIVNCNGQNKENDIKIINNNGKMKNNMYTIYVHSQCGYTNLASS